MKELAPLTPHQLEQLRKSHSNNRCAECSSQNPPDWAVPNYGISLCIDCAGIHRGLGVHVSFVRSITMDAWSKDQYDRMIRGGNDRWDEYWKKHASTKEIIDSFSITSTMDKKEIAQRLKAKYNTDVARSYMELLSSADEKNGEDLVNSSKQQHSATTAPRPVLPDDPLPTLNQYEDITYSFLIRSKMQAKKQLIGWCVFSIGGAAYAHRLGYKSYVSAGVVAMIACIPYFLIRRDARKFGLGFLNSRRERDAFKSAKNLLVDRIARGRATRLPNCDVYYPPLSSNGEREAKMGFVLYPGALVERTAYAPVATMLSDRGIMVVVANLEPTRLLLSVYNYNLKEKIMRMISDALFLGSGGVWVVDEWSIGGHSMGANVAVTAVAKEMSSTIKKVVLYGTGNYPGKTFSDSPPLREAAGVKVLVINGSEDTIVTSTLFFPDKERMFREKMPPVLTSNTKAASSDQGYTIRETIAGGNHAGCASYGPQTSPVPDGVRKITLEEQQKKTAKLTADFLLKNISNPS